MSWQQQNYLHELGWTASEITLVRFEKGMDENMMEVYFYDNGGNLHGHKVKPDGKFQTLEV